MSGVSESRGKAEKRSEPGSEGRKNKAGGSLERGRGERNVCKLSSFTGLVSGRKQVIVGGDILETFLSGILSGGKDLYFRPCQGSAFRGTLIALNLA